MEKRIKISEESKISGLSAAEAKKSVKKFINDECVDNNLYTQEEITQLLQLSEEKWKEIIEKLIKHVCKRTRNKTDQGAHSERNLTACAVDYYVSEAIEKLFFGELTWNRNLSLYEKLERTINSLITSKVKNYSEKKEKDKTITYCNFDFLSRKDLIEEEVDQRYEIYMQVREQCIRDNKELQIYVDALDQCRSFDEISTLLGWTKQKLYTLQKKLVRRITKYLESNSIEYLFKKT